MTCEECNVTGGREEVEAFKDTRVPRSPDARRGETERGGGGRATGEEDSCGNSGRGEEEREAG